MTIRLSNWACEFPDGGSDYTAPELRGLCLVGDVTGHPRRPDGTRVKTSVIRKVSGRVIETRNSVYILEGDPHPAYLAWLVEHGREYDADEPIKVGKR
jgi:hypothetical protein